MFEIKMEDGIWHLYRNGEDYGTFTSIKAAAKEIDRLRTEANNE